MPNLTYRLMVDVYNCCAIGGGGITVGVSVKTLDIFHNLMLTDVGKLVRMKKNDTNNHNNNNQF